MGVEKYYTFVSMWKRWNIYVLKKTNEKLMLEKETIIGSCNSLWSLDVTFDSWCKDSIEIQNNIT